MFAVVTILGVCIAGSSPSDSDISSPPANSLIGQKAPRFILRKLNPGRAKTHFLLRDHIGIDALHPKRGILLSFVASWCTPCVDELRALKKWYNPLATAGIGIVAVVIDREEAGIRTIKRLVSAELEIPFPVLSDRFQILAHRYGASNLPITFFINQRGIVRDIYESLDDTILDQLTSQNLSASLQSH
ncbi:MAG: peroxiredoxin family protein [Myxococcales bacterium]|nr:peroxiredoxin family protein [Myxococcales bacterium]